MKPSSHKYTVHQARSGGEWEIYDNGVLHSDGYPSRQIALDRIDELEDGEKPATAKDLKEFFAELKSLTGTS